MLPIAINFLKTLGLKSCYYTLKRAGAFKYTNMTKQTLKCPKCDCEFHYEKPRGWFLKSLSYFIPVRAYFCAKCLKTHHLIISDARLKHFHHV